MSGTTSCFGSDLSGLGSDDAGADVATSQPEASLIDTGSEGALDVSTVETSIDATPPDTAGDTDASLDVAPDVVPDVVTDPCVGKGFPSGQLGVLYTTPAPPGRPTGTLAFAGSVGVGDWWDPYPSCAGSDPSANTIACTFGGPNTVHFIVGVISAGGFKLNTGLPLSNGSGSSFSAIGTVLVCIGESQIGSYNSATGFTGKLHQWGTTEKFEIAP